MFISKGPGGPTEAPTAGAVGLGLRRCTGRAGLLCVLALVALGCDRFPRDNPVDPEGSGALMVEVNERGPVVSDLNSVAASNNENGAAEAGETVSLIVPLDVVWASSGLTGTITAEVAEDASDAAKACILAVVAQGMVGNQLLVSFPAARNQPQPVLAGPIQVALASDCEPGTVLELVLQLTVTQNGEDIRLPFELTVAEPGDGPTMTAIEVADPSQGTTLAMGNGDGILDPGEGVILAPTLENRTAALLPNIVLRVKSVPRDCFETVQVNGVVTAVMNFGTLVPGQPTTSPDLLLASVASDCAAGDNATLAFDAVDAAGRTWELSFGWVLGEPDGAPILPEPDPDADAGM